MSAFDILKELEEPCWRIDQEFISLTFWYYQYVFRNESNILSVFYAVILLYYLLSVEIPISYPRLQFIIVSCENEVIARVLDSSQLDKQNTPVGFHGSQSCRRFPEAKLMESLGKNSATAGYCCVWNESFGYSEIRWNQGLNSCASHDPGIDNKRELWHKMKGKKTKAGIPGL